MLVWIGAVVSVFGDLGILAIIMGIAFAAVLVDAVRDYRTLFAEPMTADSRSRILRLVVFGLLPASIIVHEFGHAIAVWSIGRSVVDYGFYFIYGFVSYNSFGVSELQNGWVAVAGTLMNVIMGIVVLAIFWFWPKRSSVNYMLFLFAVFQGANALIFYPIMDAFGGVAGDWSTIYSSNTPVFSAIIGGLHFTILAGSLATWQSQKFQQAYAARVGRTYRTRQQSGLRSDLAVTMSRAAADAIAGWKHEVDLVADAQQGGLQMVLRWQSEGFHRGVLVHATSPDSSTPHIEIHATIKAKDPGLPPYKRPLLHIEGRPHADDLAPHIHKALDIVDSWDASTVTSLN